MMMTRHILISLSIHLLLVGGLTYWEITCPIDSLVPKTTPSTIEFITIDSLPSVTSETNIASTPTQLRNRSLSKPKPKRANAPQIKEVHTQADNDLVTSSKEFKDENLQATEDLTSDEAKVQKLKLKFSERLKAFIEQNKVYPKRALRMRQTGTVTIKMMIRSDGKFENIQLLSSSNNPVLDNSALKLLKNLQKFGPLPGNLGDRAEFIIPLAYKLNGGRY